MSLFQRLCQLEFFSKTQVEFVHVLCRIEPALGEYVQLAAALASRAVEQGSACADLVRLPTEIVVGDDLVELDWPEIKPWRDALLHGNLVSTPGHDHRGPLVFDGTSSVYLTRYWRLEKDLADALLNHVGRPLEEIDAAWSCAHLGALFDLSQAARNRQALAAASCLLSALTVISGGPGTGKTTTVVRILALLAAWSSQQGRALPRIALFAPTGKAAARLSESISAGKRSLPDGFDGDAIPEQASTLHRGLGINPHRPSRSRDTGLLNADVVVVDECSMVDLAILSRLVQRVPSHAKLILLGDHNQLASVEVGAVLGDMVGDREMALSVPRAQALEKLLGVALGEITTRRKQPCFHDHVVVLNRSYRFDDASRLGRAARALHGGNRGDFREALAAGGPDVGFTELQDRLPTGLADLILERFGALVQSETRESALRALDGFRVLCAHRRGLWGSQHLNQVVEDHLTRHGRLSRPGTWYRGKPIMVTRNDPQLGVFNGDVGVCWVEDDELVAIFPSDEGLRSVPIAMLPTCEGVFAMTIHKSQGSEFDDVALVFPRQASPVMTRELIYTGLTRARRRAWLFGTWRHLERAIGKRVDRASGLDARLNLDEPVDLAGQEQLPLFEP